MPHAHTRPTPHRARRLLAAAAAAPVLALAAAPVALANEDPGSMTGSIAFSPRTVLPGGRITLSTKDCDASSGTATSDAFAGGSVRLGAGDGGAVRGTAQVPASVRPGRYAVTVVCGNGTAEGSFTVGAQGPVGAGGGGMAERQQASGPRLLGLRLDSASDLVGLVLLAGGATGVVVMETRRRRRARQ
ncbi:hypothetical protein BIV57_21400 [Mangrovactinospora gilvigrisea]|uniref:Sortase n=1 Tax=Mangrovactinospora gilvigrisea TaxID=1428644 RepID=A0A1J7C752_9ACTN|nr:hypothetical protein [Mangrovactinospora gilvigrisea]OIV35474.1 hypothetical protein BIV57_21400 [Mangrovactinospora gilvigrisea]